MATDETGTPTHQAALALAKHLDAARESYGDDVVEDAVKLSAGRRKSAAGQARAASGQKREDAPQGRATADPKTSGTA